MELKVRQWVRELFRSRRDPFGRCEVCGDVDGREVIGRLRDGRMACWHCAERAGEFCLVEAGIAEWRGDHVLRCVICRSHTEP